MSLKADPDYIEVRLRATGEAAELYTARLAEVGFEAFAEEDDLLLAYVQAADAPHAEAYLSELATDPAFVSRTLIAAQNWNQTWEDNFSPVVIAGRLQVRAGHHAPDPEAQLHILIEPKMSFGTGHHATTSGMARLMLERAALIEGCHVIDAGSGTGILAILAEKLGAATVEAFDHESWAVENAQENGALNQCTHLTIRHAELAGYTPAAPAGVVLANITRNLVIGFMPLMSGWLAKGGGQPGLLLCSGFYEEDLPAVREAALEAGLAYQAHHIQDRWCAAAFLQ